MSYAAIVTLADKHPEDPDRVDFIGRDCQNLDEALGQIRDVCVGLGDRWAFVTIIPGHTVAEVAAWDPGTPS